MVPLCRLGEPEDYANVAVFLASGGHHLVCQVSSIINHGFMYWLNEDLSSGMLAP